jgi:hypothetical protein
MLVPSYPLIGDGDPLGTRNPNEDEFCTHDGYGYGDVPNIMGMGLGCYNPVGNYPLTSLLTAVGPQDLSLSCCSPSRARALSGPSRTQRPDPAQFGTGTA